MKTILVTAAVSGISHISLLLPSLALGSVPIINALSDLHHPLQTLADLMTLQEQFRDLKGRTITWVGDGSSNVLHDLMLGCAILALNVNIFCPPGYEPNQGVLDMAHKLASKSGWRVKVVICLPLFIYMYTHNHLIIFSFSINH